MPSPISEASFAQHGIWVAERMGDAGTAYHMPLTLTFDAADGTGDTSDAGGGLDVPALLAACDAVVARHAVLAAAFAERDATVLLIPGAAEPARFDDRPPPGHLDEELERRFDLEKGPLARFLLVPLGPGRHRLLVVAHHAVFDGESKDILVRDLALAYAGRPMPPLPTPYAEAAGAERRQVAEQLPEAARFWSERWREEAGLALPGLIKPSLRPAPAEALDVVFGGALADAAAEVGASRFEVALTALTLLLHVYGTARPAVSVDLSTRDDRTRDHIGPFVNELPIAVAPRETFARTVAAVRDELRAVYRFRDVPLTRALGGMTPRAAITPVSLSYRKRSGGLPGFPGVGTSVDWAMFNHAVRNTLHLQIVDGPDGLTARLQYNPASIDPAGAARVAEDLVELVEAVALEPEAALRDLPLLAALPVAVSAIAAPATVTAAISGEPDEQTERMRQIWCEVLHVKQVEPDDDLFDLGGSSLSIVQIVARVRDSMGVELPFEVFLDVPTVTAIVGEVEKLR
ncbi:hypothetical protein J5X84_36775 [Streptosporangiaceae bacterium NEAU-GS5]|nr:hypothetical protein [Streptosporangiaceae bacterium NEAU-GS5]